MIKTIIEKLEAANLPQSDFVKFMETIDDPYLVLISCILSLRTNDKTTYPATLRMFELGKTPLKIAQTESKVLEKAIYPVGFYSNKAKQIINLSKVLVENYNSVVPDTIEGLLKFKGVGRKTANLVLARGFKKPAICVDIHVHRILNRIGYINTRNPEETEFALRNKVPESLWIDINTIFVTLGQNICKPQKPICKACPILNYCQKNI